MSDDWYEDAKASAIEMHAEKMGMEQGDKRWGPCPACNEGQGGSHDTRPPVAFTKTQNNTSSFNNRWYCNACERTGNVFDLVAWYTDGEFARDLSSWRNVREFFTDGSCIVDNPMEKWAVKEKGYPPADEIKAIFDSATPIHLCRDKRVLDWCRLRGLDPRKLMHGPRVLDMSFDFEGLTKIERNEKEMPWLSKEMVNKYPVIIPMVDYRGNLKSFISRPLTKSMRPKSRLPLGWNSKNLYFVNVPSWKFLTRKSSPSDIIITEGEIDFLSVSQKGYPVIGINNGSIDHLQLMPWHTGQKIHVACDNDAAGNRLANQIPNQVHPASAFRVNLHLLKRRHNEQNKKT
jgi:5S rRNA maturation endonuclease (ribonuclease M5)